MDELFGFIRHKYKIRTWGIRINNIKLAISNSNRKDQIDNLKEIVPIFRNFILKNKIVGEQNGIYWNDLPVHMYLDIDVNWEHAIYFNNMQITNNHLLEIINKELVNVSIDEYRWDYPLRIPIILLSCLIAGYTVKKLLK